jgi:hypothetical protein
MLYYRCERDKNGRKERRIEEDRKEKKKEKGRKEMREGKINDIYYHHFIKKRNFNKTKQVEVNIQ